jgi:hypothetical protein
MPKLVVKGNKGKTAPAVKGKKTVEEEPKKKPGRPPKVQEEETPKKRPGRPPAKKQEEEEPKKRPGRPPKVKEEEYEEEETPKKKGAPAKAAKKDAEEKEPTPPKGNFPKTIDTDKATYTKIIDPDFQEIKKAVNFENGGFPYRILLAETREDGKQTEFIVVYVGKKYVHGVDINSTGEKYSESVISVPFADFEKMKFDKLAFALYLRTPKKKAAK